MATKKLLHAQEPWIKAGTVYRNSGQICLRGAVATQDIQVHCIQYQPAVIVTRIATHGSTRDASGPEMG
jgi:hypothetical protein